jgi:hypothetical protein
MIGQSYGVRAGFAATMDYITHDHDEHGRQLATSDRVAWADAVSLPTDEAKAAERIMEATAAQNVRVKNPAYHFVISWTAEAQPPETEQKEVARKVLDRIGLGDHQAYLVAHKDKAHAHVHILVNRVHPETGRVWRTGNDWERIERAIGQEANLRGYEVVEGRHNARDFGHEPPPRGPHTSKELHRIARTGQRPFAEMVREHAGHDFAAATDWTDLERRLTAKGLRLERKGQGLVVTDGEEFTKASAVGAHPPACRTAG